ncbi:MAG: hypothetical protein C0501_09120 [Isosphaera sp.]|nr:hypothetical protein [Isosphaera sp.]
MATDTATTTPRMTAEEFFAWANRPENADRRWELDNGRVVEMPSPGIRRGTVCWLVGLIIGQYLFRRGGGHAACNDSGLVVRRNPDTVRGPDLMVFLDAPRFEDLEPKYAERVPQLVVEVLSPDDRPNRTGRRIEQYQRRGIPLIWFIDPEDRTVAVYRAGEFNKVLDETEELTGNGVLPDFSCRVADLFALPGQPPAAPTA